MVFLTSTSLGEKKSVVIKEPEDLGYYFQVSGEETQYQESIWFIAGSKALQYFFINTCCGDTQRGFFSFILHSWFYLEFSLLDFEDVYRDISG